MTVDGEILSGAGGGRPEGVRAVRRAEIEAQLLLIGRQQLATHGAAALSVRAVARELGMAPSALFRYISGRDELLTLLIVDGYTSLADHVDAQLAAAPRNEPPADDLALRWETLAHAVRSWAVEHQHQWALLYGSPVPDYQAPAEQTSTVGVRVAFRLAEIGADALARHLNGPPIPASDIGIERARRATSSLGDDPQLAAVGLPPVVLANGMTVWMMLIGAISTEVFQGLGPDIDHEALFEYTVGVGRQILFG